MRAAAQYDRIYKSANKRTDSSVNADYGIQRQDYRSPENACFRYSKCYTRWISNCFVLVLGSHLTSFCSSASLPSVSYRESERGHLRTSARVLTPMIVKASE